FFSCVYIYRPNNALPILYLSRSRGVGYLHSFPTRRSSDLYGVIKRHSIGTSVNVCRLRRSVKLQSYSHDLNMLSNVIPVKITERSEEHTSELQSRENLVCRLLLEKKKLSPL